MNNMCRNNILDMIPIGRMSKKKPMGMVKSIQHPPFDVRNELGVEDVTDVSIEQIVQLPNL